MRTFRSFMSHKYTARQSLLAIAAPILAGFAAIKVGEATNLSPDAVSNVGMAVAIATLIPLLIVFYRRAHA